MPRAKTARTESPESKTYRNRSRRGPRPLPKLELRPWRNRAPQAKREVNTYAGNGGALPSGDPPLRPPEQIARESREAQIPGRARSKPTGMPDLEEQEIQCLTNFTKRGDTRSRPRSATIGPLRSAR